MKRRITILVAMIVLMLAGSKPAAAQNRYIVRTGGLTAAWIAAPGESVTCPGGTYASASSTSFSSPLVAGTASLLISAKPSLNQKQAASALSHAVRLTPDLNHGRLDVYQAIAAWLNNSSSNSGSCSLFCW